MELIIPGLVVLIGLALARRGKARRDRLKTNKLPAGNAAEVEAERKRKQQEDDELITVILPTINHDNK